MQTLKPLGNRVVVKRAAHAVSKGGILLPESAQEKPKMGEVIAVGPGKLDEEGRRMPMHVKVGDRVLFTPYAGSSFEPQALKDHEILVMSEDEILGIMV